MADLYYKVKIAYDAVTPPPSIGDATELQTLFDGLNSGDMLILNKDYELDQTVILSQRNITVVGRGCEVRRKNSSWLSPGTALIEIIPGGSADTNDIVIDGLRIIDMVSPEGTGDFTGIHLSDSGDPGGVYHVKLSNLNLSNFGYGVRLEDVFDIVLDNCQISKCNVAIRSEYADSGVGQIKIFGGFFIYNTYGISIDQSGSGLYQGQVMVFGASFGHKRNPDVDTYNFGIFVGKPIGGIFLFGNHFEDVSNVLMFPPPFANTSSEPMVVSAIGNSFFGITGECALDMEYAKPEIDAVAVLGNYNWHSGGTASTTKLARIRSIDPAGQGGVIMAGNALTQFPTFDDLTFQETNAQVYPLPVFSYSEMERPAANTVPKGTAILYINNLDQTELNVSDGTNWKKVVLS
jgi:hypothetical protein